MVVNLYDVGELVWGFYETKSPGFNIEKQAFAGSRFGVIFR